MRRTKSFFTTKLAGNTEVVFYFSAIGVNSVSSVVNSPFHKKTNESFIVISAFKILVILFALITTTGLASSADTESETKPVKTDANNQIHIYVNRLFNNENIYH